MAVKQRLLTPRFVLRAFKPEEFIHFRRFMEDPKATEYLLLSPSSKTEEGIKELFDQLIKSYESLSPAIAFVIADKGNDQYVGIVGLCEDFNSHVPQLFWYIEPPYRNSGFALEAVKETLRYAFDTLKVRKVVCYLNPEDGEYIQIAKQAGMHEGGLLHSKATDFKAMYFYIEI